MSESKRQRIERLGEQMRNERQSFVPHWRDLNDYILTRRGRFFVSDSNKGERRNLKIIDSTATLAARTLRSGMMGGITSPARPWFRLTTPDPDLSEYPSTKEWLHVSTNRMEGVFLKSNLYNTLPIIYGDMGTFATSAMLVEEDFDDIIRTYPFPIGSYMVANDSRLRVRTFFREYRMTVRQIIEQFGQRLRGEYMAAEGARVGDRVDDIDWSNISLHVKNQYVQGQLEDWVDVSHVVTANSDYSENRSLAKDKRYISCYFEKGMGASASGSMGYMQPGEKDLLLRESGYDYFPVLVPRWEVTGEDVYGTDCPGMTCLGDVKALQVMQKRKAQAIEKMVNPPMNAAGEMRNSKTSILPGDINYLPSGRDVAAGGLRPVHEVRPPVQELLGDIQDHQARINRSFYVDLFLMLANDNRADRPTAAEIAARQQEKLLALGPVLEQLNQDLLDPLISITFGIMLKRGLIPEPPEELQGTDLRVEYTSIMAQAQKVAGLAGLERTVDFMVGLAERTQRPDVLDKLNLDEVADEHGKSTGVAPRVIRSDEDVEAIRQQREQQAQQAQQMESLKTGADAAKSLAGADLSGDNALSRMAQLSQAGQVVPT